MLIVSSIYRLQCTNGVLLGKMAASKNKWILNNCHPLEIFNCIHLCLFTECASYSTALEILSNKYT